MTEQALGPTPVPPQRTPPQAPGAEPTQPTTPSPAYLALARLGRDDHRLGLSADDCTTLEPLAAQWLDRGVTTDYLTSTLTAGLPAEVGSPVGLLRRRLIDKLPPLLPATPSTPADTPAPARRLLVECTDCGHPGPPKPSPTASAAPAAPPTPQAAGAHPTPPRSPLVKAHMANLRDLLKPV